MREKKPVLLLQELPHFAPDHPPLPPLLPGERHQRLKSSLYKSNLLPDGRLSLNPLLGPLQLSPAVSLPLLAKLPPWMNRLLKEEQQAAADKMEEEMGKQNGTKHPNPVPC